MSPLAPSAAWRSRSISRSSAPRTIPGCSEHKKWFQYRPDGSIKFAENPPKKYEDIVNVDFYNPDREGLWKELRDVVLFWIDQGVRIFRVDNPHTKPVPFWEWMIREVKARCPDAVFLAEAFTRPKMMRALAKAGFTQSYTYFTWRNTKGELIEYLTELTQGPAKEYFRPNFFANTPDILPVFLQEGGRPAFRIRLALAGTLSPCYGIYNGFELCENAPIPGREEYIHSEKYEYKVWDWDRPGNIKRDVAILNRFRRDNPALHELTNLRFLDCPDPNILAYAKMSADGSNIVIAVVNLDPHGVHGGRRHPAAAASGESIRARNFGSKRRLPGMSCPGAASGSIWFSTRRSTRRCSIGCCRLTGDGAGGACAGVPAHGSGEQRACTLRGVISGMSNFVVLHTSSPVERS